MRKRGEHRAVAKQIGRRRRVRTCTRQATNHNGIRTGRPSVKLPAKQLAATKTPWGPRARRSKKKRKNRDIENPTSVTPRSSPAPTRSWITLAAGFERSTRTVSSWPSSHALSSPDQPSIGGPSYRRSLQQSSRPALARSREAFTPLGRIGPAVRKPIIVLASPAHSPLEEKGKNRVRVAKYSRMTPCTRRSNAQLPTGGFGGN